MNNKPLISVVIPAYNRENTIHYCLKSITEQSYENFEVLVVDDCSTDDTATIVKSFADRRIRCLTLESRSGAQAARNRGIRESSGEWIAFQDSDDEWYAEKLDLQVGALGRFDFDPWTVIHCNGIWVDDVRGKRLPEKVPAIEGDCVYEALLRNPGPMFQGMLVSRAALDRINYLDTAVPSYQEWDTAISLARLCRFVYISEPLFVYHLIGDETISKDKKREVLGYQYVIDKHKKEIMEICGTKAWEQHLLGQLARCLDYRFWDESDRYLSEIQRLNLRRLVLALFRRTHITPFCLVRLKQTMVNYLKEVLR